MIRNYLKIAFRNLWKHRMFTVLNTVGLSIAFAIAILLSMTAIFHLNFDSFHNNLDRTYLLYRTEQTPKGPESSISNPEPLTPALKEEIPGIASITRHLQSGIIGIFGEKEINLDILYTDPDFFSVFSFPSIAGDARQALQSGQNIIITQKIAKIMFGDDTAIGKNIMLMLNGVETPFTVATVLEDIPRQSSFHFDIIVNFVNNPAYSRQKGQWDYRNHEVFLTLQEGVSVETFQKNTRAFSNRYFEDDIKKDKRDGAQADANGQYIQLNLFPFKDWHFIRQINGRITGGKTFPFLIIGISLLILFIACVNFINMSVGINIKRLREIGVRKTLGAAKKQLFFQFWCESIIVFAISIVTGILLSKALLPGFKTLFRTGAVFSDMNTPVFLWGTFIVLLIVTLLGGGYPAFRLSKLNTVQTLKGTLKVQGKNRLRNLLVVVQFSIAILLISCTITLYSQLQYMQGKDLGFNKEQVISLPLNGKKDSQLVLDLLRNELLPIPEVQSITAADNNLGLGRDGSRSTSAFDFDYKGKGVNTNMLVVDYDYLKTLGISLVAGRSFDRNFSRDSLSVIINESLAKELGGQNILNTPLSLLDSKQHTVIGIIKDFHFRDLDQAIEPITLFFNRDKQLDYAYIKVNSANLAQSLSVVKEAWKKAEPNAEFLGSYLDENINRTLDREKTMTTLITCGSIIAILLSCMGIFAISLLTIAQRTKEVGIRKVVGASISSITILLSKDFIRLVIVAFLIAAPIAWWLMYKWLQNYSYRINLSIWFFVVAGVITVLIAFATLSIRTIRAAMANPVKSLKTE
ncbi:FtsX-like permease family protein [Sinomicrobium pectinilyticum]|uniref:FtsX-like permease family protein n=1 Tax=Sinomicrobium pectinilyticum TaxID=1084421 RepID=A0A3N0ES79_SINP1|nr:ABC transporter permease [Sinomicrobium pectinilyticum]RNL90631.1 FtsX-like permease family protein [Sinomicrobium pectinilyticum]